MKKIPYFFWLAFLSIFMLWSSNESGHLRLPFRVMGERAVDIALDKSDVQLTVNGRPTEIIRLIRQERSLARTPDLGRNFVLSFHIDSVPQAIADSVAFFVSEILNTRDILILLTPTKAYRIPVSIDKTQVVMDVVNALRKDTSSYVKDRMSAEKRLEKEIDGLNTVLSGRSENAATDLTDRSFSAYDLAANYNAIHQFFLNFPESLSHFQDRYLLPNIVRHREIHKLLGKRQGERWWIHFQHREDIRVIHKAHEIGRKLSAYISSQETGGLARTLSQELSDFEKRLLISDSIPQDEISDTLHKGNICYNVVFWGTLKTSGHGSFVKESSDLEDPLRRVSDSSGGITVVVNDPENGLMAIRNHTDRFFEIIFGREEDIVEARIQVLIKDQQVPLRYKQEFSKNEIEEWIAGEMDKTVEIDELTLEDRTLRFVLCSFQKDPENKYGVLKVRVRLRDGQNTDVYKSENTLRAAEDRVTVSIPLPEKYRGDFRLSVSVFDLLANTDTSYERDIRLY